VVRSVSEAWSLDPIGSLRLGQVDHPVPPLTFARFQRLLGLDHAAFTTALAGGDTAAAWSFVTVCCPGVTRGEWEEWGGQREVARLFLLFVEAHGWSAIGEAIRFGETMEDGETLPTRTEITAGLLSIAKATGYTIEALYAMRVDGFYLLVETLREGRPPVEEPGTMPAGIGVETDPEALARVSAILEGATRG
jgi:hypothetical protein